MSVEQRRRHVLGILAQRSRYQFGQRKSSTVKGGAVACTDTSIQMAVLMARGKDVSLDEVRRRSGAPDDVPMTRDQALLALRRFGLPYEARTGILAAEALRLARTRGPLILCERYWAHPDWQGSATGWATDDAGRRVQVGFAEPSGRAGQTQQDFRDGHAVLVATDLYEDGRHWAVVRDPNHHSPARPERPAWDQVTLPQLNRMIRSWPGGLLLVPTRPVIT